MNDSPDYVICNLAIYTDDTTFKSKCDPASELWQQQEMAVEVEFYLPDTGLGKEVPV